MCESTIQFRSNTSNMLCHKQQGTMSVDGSQTKSTLLLSGEGKCTAHRSEAITQLVC